MVTYVGKKNRKETEKFTVWYIGKQINKIIMKNNKNFYDHYNEECLMFPIFCEVLNVLFSFQYDFLII